MFANRPANLDGGVEQLLRYCSKFQDSGDLVTAAGLCERAHKLEPTNPAPLMQLADILLAMQRPEQAVKAYRTAIEGAPKYVEARYALGKLYINLGQYDLAAAEFQAALQRKSDDPRIYNALGITHGLSGANESALQSFEAGLKVAPKHISLRNNLGLSLVLNGRYDEGIKVLEDVAADPKANETSHQNLQLAYGMINTASSGQGIAGAGLASYDAAQGSGNSGELHAIPAGEQPHPEPEGQTAASPVVMRDPEIEDGAAADEAPVQLIQAAQLEKAQGRLGGAETPIEMSVIDDSANADQAPAPSTGEANSPWRSPLRVQTARAASTDLEDSSSPSAVMGDYITAEASFEQTPAEPRKPAASEPEVAAAQPMTPTQTETNIEPSYAVQLASYLSEERAIRGWTELRSVAPDLLDPIEPVVRRADLDEDRGTFYRLRTAPTTKDDANALCMELQSRGIDCLVIKEAPGDSAGASQTG
jgi:Flp pilus assembly protein TadD